MAGFGNKVKLTVLKGMEAVGQSASSLASNAQHKLQELNLETQRREILSAFPLRAYDLWQKGEALPEELAKMLKELSELDERLGILRAQRYAKVENGEADKEQEAPAEGQTDGAPEAEQASDVEAAPETAPEAEPQSPAEDTAGEGDEPVGGNA